MKDVLLRIVETAPQSRTWTSELWSEFPGKSGAVQLAGNASPFTQAQLEAPLSDGTAMDRASVVRALQVQDAIDTIFLEIGMRLYELLDRTGTAAEWRKLRDAEEQTGGGVRTYLDLPDFLADWPWELLAWRVGPGLATRGFNVKRHPIVRLASPPMPQLEWNESTVRILLVSGREELDPGDPNSKASIELRLIRKIFQNANVSAFVDLCEAPADRNTLEAHITKVAPHVLHFIAHGDIPANDFMLEFARSGAQSWWWSANLILQFFRDLFPKPRLVVLNACHSARREAHAGTVTSALLEAGIPSVIGARAALQIDFARLFSVAFYEALARGETVDRAMVIARDFLSGTGTYAGLDRRHWALPVLAVRAPVQGIVKLKRASQDLNQCEVAKEVFKRPGAFVNRTADRWSMLSAFHPADPTAPCFRGVILEGTTPRVGKKWLMMRAMRDFLDCGFIVRYAELVCLQQERTSLDVLEDWRGHAGRVSPVVSRVPGSHFDAFDEALAAARQPGGMTATNVADVFRTFKAGLQSYRNGKNVLLVLGRFREKGKTSVLSQDFRENLLEKLLLPIQATDPVDAEVAGIHCLLILREHTDLESGQRFDLEEFALRHISAEIVPESNRQPADGFRRVRIDDFLTEEVDRHFDEFSEFDDDPKVCTLLPAIKEFVERGSNTWSPSMLELFDKLVVKAQQLKKRKQV